MLTETLIELRRHPFPARLLWHESSTHLLPSRPVGASFDAARLPVRWPSDTLRSHDQPVCRAEEGGLALTRRFKAARYLAGVPVIMTADARRETLISSMEGACRRRC